MEVAEVAARAAGENFPVGSLLFPRALRPHVRALYCYARLVDELGDEYDGDRLAALDELEQEVALTFEGEPTWPVLANVQPTMREFDLPREPFERLIEANRMDQRISEYETWDDLKGYCVHSADPCGRLVLGVLAPARRSRSSSRERRRVHRASARQLPPGRAARPRARPRLPAGRGSAALRRSAARPAERRARVRCFASRRSGRAGLLAAGELLRARIGGRLGPRRRTVRPRRARRARRARVGGLGRLHAAARPSRARLAREAALRRCVR